MLALITYRYSYLKALTMYVPERFLSSSCGFISLSAIHNDHRNTTVDAGPDSRIECPTGSAVISQLSKA
jgi:hypothetical protein